MAISESQARMLTGLNLDGMLMPMGASTLRKQNFKHERDCRRATEFKKESEKWLHKFNHGGMKVCAQVPDCRRNWMAATHHSTEEKEPIEFQRVARIVLKLHQWFRLSHRLLTRDMFCCWWRESRIPYRCHPRIKISGPSLPRHSGVYLTSLELLPRVAPKLSDSFDIRFLKALYDGQFTSMPFSIGLLRGCVQRVHSSKDLVMFPIYCRLGWLEFTNECQILHVRQDYVD